MRTLMIGKYALAGIETLMSHCVKMRVDIFPALESFGVVFESAGEVLLLFPQEEISKAQTTATEAPMQRT